MKKSVFIEGTFASPTYYIAESNPAHSKAQDLFNRIKWHKPLTRADSRRHRFNAFCSLLWAVTSDADWVTHTILNKSHYNISKWPINYRAMADTVAVLKEMGWLVVIGERTKNRNIRYMAPPKSPMRKIDPFKINKLQWYAPDVSIRLGKTDLAKGPLDAELMSNPKMKRWIKKYLTPVMEDLNDKLSDHSFTLFPFGKPDEFIEVQYQRIYTNLPRDDGSPWLTHGRIYPQTFRLPSKKNGWRQKTLIDDKSTVEVDVHASSLMLLSQDYHIGFDLPDTDDLYRYGPLANLKRDLTKKIIQAVINGVSLDRKSWPRSFREDTKTAGLMAGEDWLSYATAIKETYPSLLQVRENFGMDLMLQESDIIINGMNYLLDRGIGCLSIHDCLIVPQENLEDAKNAFYTAYEKKNYNRPKLSVEYGEDSTPLV